MDHKLEAAVERANEALQLAEANQPGRAVEILQDLIGKFPDMIGARVNLGALLDRTGKFEQALGILKEAIRLQPNFAQAWNNMGLTLFHLTRTRAAYDAFTRAVQIDPDYFEAHSNRCLMPLYRNGAVDWQAQSLNDWRKACLRLELKNKWAEGPPPAGESLRIGFVSPDFRIHSVAYFLLPVIQYWTGKSGLELYLYSDVPQPDRMTDRFRTLAVNYVPTSGLSNQELIDRIKADRIEVLFELCGHFTHNRLPVFASRASPLQIAWLGYPKSSGTPNIDYRIADTISAPVSDPSLEPESVLRLDTGYHCYTPPAESPMIEASPFSRTRPFTFGCFNNAFKISPEIAHIWGKILQNNPGSRLLLKAKSFANSEVCEQILKWIHPDPSINGRVDFRSRDQSLVDHLKTYNLVDLSLDTFPYNGTTTTCESLWMGVPCITLCGGPSQSRVGASLLHQAQLKHFIATSPERYIQLASLLAAHPEKLKSYRSGLRSHLNRTSLRDPALVGEALLEQIKEIIHKREDGAKRI